MLRRVGHLLNICKMSLNVFPKLLINLRLKTIFCSATLIPPTSLQTIIIVLAHTGHLRLTSTKKKFLDVHFGGREWMVMWMLL